MLTVGIPKEIKPFEKRVGLTPEGVGHLTAEGIKVFVETRAGLGSGASDSRYRDAGAEIVPGAASLYKAADLIQKVKEPLFPEFDFLESRHLIFSYLHLASPENCDLVTRLAECKATALAYETVEVEGRYPLLAPMSEIAGALAAAYAAALQHLGLAHAVRPGSTNVFGALEKAAAQYPRFARIKLGNTVIFGGGVAGFQALQTAGAFQAETVVVEMNSERREFLKRFASAVYSPQDVPKSVLKNADVLIGSVHARGERAARVIDEALLKEVSKHKNKIIVDIAIDQGGNFPESRPTTYQNPVYFDSFQNLRFGVPNIPSLCGKGASEALSRVTLPYTLALARDPQKAFQDFPELVKGINVQNGEIQLGVIRDAHKK